MFHKWHYCANIRFRVTKDGRIIRQVRMRKRLFGLFVIECWEELLSMQSTLHSIHE